MGVIVDFVGFEVIFELGFGIVFYWLLVDIEVLVWFVFDDFVFMVLFIFLDDEDYFFFFVFMIVFDFLGFLYFYFRYGFGVDFD